MNQRFESFVKLEGWAEKFAEKISDSTLADFFSDRTSSLDQRIKTNLTYLFSYSLALAPLLFVLIITLVNQSIKTNNSRHVNLEKQIKEIESNQKKLDSFKSKLMNATKFSSATKASSFFQSLMRGGKLPSTAFNVSEIQESFTGQLKKISLTLNFNKLGSRELSQLIKGIQRKTGTRITELNIRSEQTSKLALGTMKLEIVTK